MTLTLSLLYRWEKGGLERLRNPPKVPRLLTGRAGVQPRQPHSRTHILNCDATHAFGCDAPRDGFPVRSVGLLSFRMRRVCLPNVDNYKNLDRYTHLLREWQPDLQSESPPSKDWRSHQWQCPCLAPCYQDFPHSFWNSKDQVHRKPRSAQIRLEPSKVFLCLPWWKIYCFLIKYLLIPHSFGKQKVYPNCISKAREK